MIAADPVNATTAGRPNRVGRVRFTGVLAASFVASLCAASPSVAQADDGARNLAEQMFVEGRKLMGEAKFDEACPKLAESERLDPGGGTILNLAVCHEGQGRFASAWSEFREALALARTDGRRDREQLALDHLAQIEPKISHLTLAIDPGAEVSGLTITLDGQAIGRAAWSSSLPVDPGAHDITASAPGKLARHVEVRVVDPIDSRAVTILPLEEDPVSLRAGNLDSVAELTSPAPSTGKKAAGFIVGGIGLAALGVGTLFGIEALQKRHESDASCSGNSCATPRGVDLNDDARRFANISDVGLGVGIVGLVVGTYLVLTGNGHRSVRASTAFQVEVSPVAGPDTPRVQLSGTW